MSTRGITTTKKGYIRITSGEHRHKYQHRRVVEHLLETEWHPFFGDRLPDSVDVHHCDGIHAHNCHCNLLILDRAIHAAISRAAILRCPYTGRFLTVDEYRRMYGSTERNIPAWVTEVAA